MLAKMNQRFLRFFKRKAEFFRGQIEFSQTIFKIYFYSTMFEWAGVNYTNINCPLSYLVGRYRLYYKFFFNWLYKWQVFESVCIGWFDGGNQSFLHNIFNVFEWWESA